MAVGTGLSIAFDVDLIELLQWSDALICTVRSSAVCPVRLAVCKGRSAASIACLDTRLWVKVASLATRAANGHMTPPSVEVSPAHPLSMQRMLTLPFQQPRAQIQELQSMDIGTAPRLRMRMEARVDSRVIVVITLRGRVCWCATQTGMPRTGRGLFRPANVSTFRF